MLRTALLCFIVGLLIVIAGLAVVDSSQSKGGKASGESWSYQDMRVVKGLPRQAGKATAIQFDAAGQAIVEVSARQALMEDLPLLHLDFKERSDVLAMIVSWRSAATGERLQYRRIGVSPGRSFWLNMASEQSWTGAASTLAVIFLGPPGGSVVLESMEILPAVFPYSMYPTLADWATFVPWQHSSINSHIGASSIATTTLPVLAIAVILLAAVLVYLVAALVLKERLRFQWSVVGVIFLLSWIVLDFFWQGRLLRQAELTRETFAGKSPAEKRQAGGDRELYNLITAVHDAVDASDASDAARVLVSSASDYNGMRGAYYLYPKNVFWQRHAKILPDPKYLHSGDYVLLLQPSSVIYDTQNSYLRYGAMSRLKVKLLLSSDLGSLYQVI
ncbi:hypothetical protein R0135_14475 [Congregibacter variabilis]|uniref:Uncharacterized protein n=1 Tax=Congregibacter variabilis TaxID=3081200 RepID=A0ABZ0I2G9_9GAMM|nr:hypothetical protein R0135_14475 [Congregibacter sp. IMCC43200]